MVPSNKEDDSELRYSIGIAYYGDEVHAHARTRCGRPCVVNPVCYPGWLRTERQSEPSGA